MTNPSPFLPPPPKKSGKENYWGNLDGDIMGKRRIKIRLDLRSS